MNGWQPIETVPKDGGEVVLGFAGSGDMDFYRWNETLARDANDPEIFGWADRASDPPHQRPTHWMRIEPPDAK